MGTRRAALHLDLFEQPGEKRVFQQPAGPRGDPMPRRAQSFDGPALHARASVFALRDSWPLGIVAPRFAPEATPRRFFTRPHAPVESA